MAGKMFVIFFPIFLFVTSGFEHSIANMYYIPAGIFAKGAFGTQPAEVLASLNWGSFVTGNLIPVTLGNIVGGVLFVGTAYWFTQYRKPGK
jgi:formate/nitrite transporter FocA (FNT family)